MCDTALLDFRVMYDSELCDVVDLLNDDNFGAHRETPSQGGTVADSYAQAYAKIKQNPLSDVHVLVLNNEVIGCAQLTVMPTLALCGTSRAEVEGVRIKSNYRGAGYGRYMFEHIRQQAKNSGATLLQLTTNVKREGSIKFYQKFGFSISHLGCKMEI